VNRQLRRALWRYIAHQLWWNWNPISWISDAENTASGFARDLEDLWKWVIKETVKLGDEIWDDYTSIYTLVLTLVDMLVREVGLIWGAIERHVGSIGGDLGKLYQWILNEIAAGVKDAEHLGEHLFSVAYDDALNWFHDAERFSWKVADWLEAHVIRPAVHDLEVAVRDAEREAVRLAEELYHDVILKALHDAEKAWAEAVRVGRWLDLVGYDAVKLVERCWDFLEWVAAHPAAALETIPRLVERELSPGWAIGAAEEAEKSFAKMVEAVEGVF